MLKILPVAVFVLFALPQCLTNQVIEAAYARRPYKLRVKNNEPRKIRKVQADSRLIRIEIKHKESFAIICKVWRRERLMDGFYVVIYENDVDPTRCDDMQNPTELDPVPHHLAPIYPSSEGVFVDFSRFAASISSALILRPRFNEKEPFVPERTVQARVSPDLSLLQLTDARNHTIFLRGTFNEQKVLVFQKIGDPQPHLEMVILPVVRMKNILGLYWPQPDCSEWECRWGTASFFILPGQLSTTYKPQVFFVEHFAVRRVPNRAYWLLLPFAVVGDIVLLPFQVVGIIVVSVASVVRSKFPRRCLPIPW